MTLYETGPGINLGTFGLADECSTTELTFLLNVLTYNFIGVPVCVACHLEDDGVSILTDEFVQPSADCVHLVVGAGRVVVQHDHLEENRI